MTIQNFSNDRDGISPGTVVSWNGKLSNIPSGYALCDGNNGTPDMRNRFVRGNPSGSSPGGTGGSNSVQVSASQMPSHGHNMSTKTSGSHDHKVNYDKKSLYRNWGNDIFVDGSDSMNTTTDGSHGHNVTTDSTGSGSSVENRPSFYELAFIMRL